MPPLIEVSAEEPWASTTEKLPVSEGGEGGEARPRLNSIT